jgi:hypothetical protein
LLTSAGCKWLSAGSMVEAGTQGYLGNPIEPSDAVWLHIFEGKENLTEIRQGLARGNDSALSPREAVKKFLNMLL